MEEKLEVALKDIQIFFMQAEIEKRYDKQLTDYFLKCHAIIESALKDCTIQNRDCTIQNTILKEHEKELIAEQHRLFDLAKEQEAELSKYKRAKELCKKVVTKPIYEKHGDIIRKSDYRKFSTSYGFEGNVIWIMDGTDVAWALDIDCYGTHWAFTKKELEAK